MYVSTYQAAGSYSAHILTYSSRWWGPSMDESLVRYSKLSMMTATNRFSICTCNKLLDTSAQLLFVAHSIFIQINNGWFLNFFYYSSYQEWTKENKGDEVEVGKLAATFRICVPWQGVTLFIPQTGQHNLMPRFSCCTPKKTHAGSLLLKESLLTNSAVSTRWTHLKRSMRAWMNVLKLLCWLMAISSSSPIAMFPNN